jgi:hypothetical protein
MGRQPGTDDPDLVDLGGRHVRAKLTEPPGPAQRPLGPVHQLVGAAGQAAEVHQAAADQPERLHLGVRRVRGEHEAGARMRGLERAAETVEDQRQASGTPAQRLRPLEPLLRGGPAHLAVHVGDQRPLAPGVDE